MLYLSGSAEPSSIDELINAIEAGLRQAVTFAPGAKIIQARGEYPALEELTFDLSGGRVDPSRLPPKPVGIGPVGSRVTVKSLRLLAKPLRLGPAGASIDLTASNALLHYDRDSAGCLLFMLSGWSGARLSVEIPCADLEALMLAEAAAPAAEQGVKITRLELQLTQRGQHSLDADARVTAKKLMVSGTIRISGTLDVDNQLIAHLSNLHCFGDGIIGKLATVALAPKLRQFDGRAFPLAAFVPAGFKPADVRLTGVDPVVRVEAEFGVGSDSEVS